MMTPDPLTTDMTQFDGQRSFVTFQLTRQTYALPIEPIGQIVEMVLITPLPQAQAPLKGLINWHGVFVPVLDLSQQLGMPDRPVAWNAHIILIKHEACSVGLIVDEVKDVIKLAAHQISRPVDVLPAGLSDTAPVVGGLAHLDGNLILLLNLDQLLTGVTFMLEELMASLPPGEETAAEPAGEPHPAA